MTNSTDFYSRNYVITAKGSLAGSKAHRQLIYPMKHALALILACCTLVAQDKAAVPAPIDLFDPVEDAKNGKIAKEARALSKSAEIGLLVAQINSLADSIKQNDELAKRMLSAAGTKGISFEAASALTKSYVDISMLALEQRKLWTQTLSRVMDLSK
jgi:hypothetical protein